MPLTIIFDPRFKLIFHFNNKTAFENRLFQQYGLKATVLMLWPFHFQLPPFYFSMTPLVLIFYFWVLQLLQQTGTLAPALNARRPKIRSKSGPCWSVIGTRKISWWSWHGGVYEVMLMALMMESSGMYDNFWPWVGGTIKMLFLVLCTWKSVIMITQKVRRCHCNK